MKLNQIFAKPVDRVIEGVIKADDLSSLRTEVEEYVLTNEVSKRLETFLEAYTNYTGANGAWISGFFGSGKSHLLKILSMLLENYPIEGDPMVDLFLGKCRDNEILKGSIKKSVEIPSKSILFNIDQKADVINKNQTDALLTVFMKVFDEMCGYYGKLGFIAKFERDLDKRGIYQQFKDEYQAVAGKLWTSGREEIAFELKNVDTALSHISETSLETSAGIIEHYRKTYTLSIEDFALLVKEYIDKHGSSFRLNFFVDEVGQFIANNTKLMTNLQTIAESLATKCGGRSWIIVTAQEDLEKVIGQVNASQANDFSKIQDRFKTRMKLTSQNVDEVIEKRLLAKTEQGGQILSRLHENHKENLETLFKFSDGSQTYANYRNVDKFNNSIPFVPYQFTLFQQAIQGISEHNAFEGRHSSVGERSMLAVFQDVARHLSEFEVGQLATFDLMFEGISKAVKSQIQSSINIAEKNLDNRFAVRVLKALFLVKYIKSFKATVHNISILMTDSFDVDLNQLHKQVQEALDILYLQTYIQRTGEIYEYLTSDEKDIEAEIKNTSVDTSDLMDYLHNLVFNRVIREKKITFDDYRQDYPFTQLVDDTAYGKTYETAIRLISPFNSNFDSQAVLLAQSMGRDELLVIMPSDERLMQDLYMYKRTEKYIQQNSAISQQDVKQRIMMEKASQNQERAKQLETRVKALLVEARLFSMGSELTVPSTDAASRIMRAFQDVIRKTFPNLSMLHGVAYSEVDISSHLIINPGLFSGDSTMLNEAEQEILHIIQNNTRSGVSTTIKKITDTFEKKPYGWSLAAVQCTLARLYAHGKVEFRKGGAILENNSLVHALKNTQDHPSTILEPQVEFSAAQVRRLKEFFEDYFDRPPQAAEAREIGRETGAELNQQLQQLKMLLESRGQYPFLGELSQPILDLTEVAGKSYNYYLTEFTSKMEAFLDNKEKTITPILAFWNGPQKKVYEDLMKFLGKEQENFDALQSEDTRSFQEKLHDPHIFQGGRLNQVKNLMDDLRARLADALQREKELAVKTLEEARTKTEGMTDYQKLSGEEKTSVQVEFTTLVDQIKAQALIAKVRDIKNRFTSTGYPSILTNVANLANPPKPPASGGGALSVREGPIEVISQNSIPIHYDKPILENEQDLDHYLDVLRKAYLEKIHQGKRIQV